MARGILGRKLGMTQVFNDQGHIVPVTVIEAGPCVVVQRRSRERDGYEAIQVGFGPTKEQRVNRPLKGHFARAGVAPVRHLREFRVEDSAAYEVGQILGVDMFRPGDTVDVVGRSKGKGFAGGVRRHGFKRGPMAHGSKYHRGVGSLASRAGARVFKGRRMPGHLGAERVTVRGLKVVEVDADRNLLILKGAVPGPRGGLVSIREAKATRREKV
ncbi:MAG: 50S ribosomal protein L3 [Bacillota bacterium]|jgi:large subunit ribosomal protein L3